MLFISWRFNFHNEAIRAQEPYPPLPTLSCFILKLFQPIANFLNLQNIFYVFPPFYSYCHSTQASILILGGLLCWPFPVQILYSHPLIILKFRLVMFPGQKLSITLISYILGLSTWHLKFSMFWLISFFIFYLYFSSLPNVFQPDYISHYSLWLPNPFFCFKLFLLPRH